MQNDVDWTAPLLGQRDYLNLVDETANRVQQLTLGPDLAGSDLAQSLLQVIDHRGVSFWSARVKGDDRSFFVLTLAMSVGIFGAFMGMWLPRL